MALCLSAGALQAVLAVHTFSLSWIHSIEKTRWQEHWQVSSSALVLTAASVEGFGAGVDVPPESRFESGVWHYQPQSRHDEIKLSHSPYAAGYRLCAEHQCWGLEQLLPELPPVAVVSLKSCP